MAELVMTAGEIATDPARWLELRRHGITATDAAVIVAGVSWDTPFSLWHRKRGNVPDLPDSDLFRYARHQESYIYERWCEATGTDWVRQGGLWRDGWRMATPDYLISDTDPGGGRCVACKHYRGAHFREGCDGDMGVNCSCTQRDYQQPPDHYAAVLECKTVGSWDGWGFGKGHEDRNPDHDFCTKEDTNEVPDYVRVQALWQADVVGVPVAHVAAVHRSTGQFRWYQLDGWASGAEHKQAVDQCWDFMRSLDDGTPPPVDGAEATLRTLKALHQLREPTTTADIDRQLYYQWENAREVLRHAEARKKHAEAQIRDAMGDAKHAEYTDELLERHRIFTRTVSKVAGHWVAPHERDTLTPIRQKVSKADD